MTRPIALLPIAAVLLAALPAPAAPGAGKGEAASQRLRIAQSEPRGMKFEVFIRLKVGMSEAELLQRAGAPDYSSTDGTDSTAHAIIRESAAVDPASGAAVGRRDVIRSERTGVVRSWYYLPTIADPFTTRVTLIGGRIAEIERTKKF